MQVSHVQKNCPIDTPIPQIMNLLNAMRYEEAAEMLFFNNPLSAVTSVVCPHKANCLGHCILGRKKEPIRFYELEQQLSKWYLENFKVPAVPRKNRRVAVVGSGPSGITMSFFLLYAGYDITIFEALDEFGGVLRYGIPQFRLSKDFLDHYKNILLKMGMKFRPNSRIGTNLTVNDLLFDGYDAVFVATGTGKPRRFGLLGETLGHVHYAVDYLKSPASVPTGKKVVVMGVGNVAMDVARTAFRNGAEEVKLIHYKNSDSVTASEDELEDTKKEGGELVFLTQIVKIENDCVRCVKVIEETGAGGSKTYTENYKEAFTIDADMVVIAIGQGPGYDIQTGYDIRLNRSGLMETNEFGETSKPGVFAAGDIVSGPKTVVDAVSQSKKVSERIIE